MSRSVKMDYDKIRVGGRGSGKRAHARQSAAQFARDEIAKGVDPQTLLSLVDHGGVRTITYEEAAEMAFIADIIDKEMEDIMKEYL